MGARGAWSGASHSVCLSDLVEGRFYLGPSVLVDSGVGRTLSVVSESCLSFGTSRVLHLTL